jgi:glucuronate isomerase
MIHAEAAVREALDSVRVVDPHCHLRAGKPTADNLADLVLYHHVWIELVSAGMSPLEVTRAGLPHEVRDPEMAPLERVRRALPFLPRIQTTTLGLFLRWLLNDLYGIEALTEANLEDAFARVAERGRDPAWLEELLRRNCGIDASITVESRGAACVPGMLRAVEDFPGNLVSGKQTTAQVVAGMDAALGREVRTPDDYREFVRRRVAGRLGPELRFWGCWVLPSLGGDGSDEREAGRVLERARRGSELTPDELGRFCSFGLACLLEELEKRTSIRTVQLIVGAEVLPPHRAVTHWHGNFAGAMARIAGRFEGLHFNLSSASDLFTQDLGTLAKHVPNLSVAGYWWHTFYPFYIRKSLETRLDMVPLDKIVGFFSDAYHAEWCYPKLKLVKHVLGEVLVERVHKGWYTVDMAREIVTKLLSENPRRIYGVPSGIVG